MVYGILKPLIDEHKDNAFYQFLHCCAVLDIQWVPLDIGEFQCAYVKKIVKYITFMIFKNI